MILGIQMMWQETFCRYTFTKDYIDVTIEGKYPDKVAISWVDREDELPPDAPIVLICPGLSCKESNLPGTFLYGELLQKPWRVGVFLKRFIAGPLQSPCFHMFGHPTDLEAVVEHIAVRYPRAPVHLVGMSSGNGLIGSFGAFCDKGAPNVASYLLLLGGADYRTAFSPRKADWRTRVLHSVVLLPSAKYFMLQNNEAVLKKHNKVAYEAALATSDIAEFYRIVTEAFSGYKNEEECNRKINGFPGGNRLCTETIKSPFLLVFAEDDPVEPDACSEEWRERFKESTHTATAIFKAGSHLACYDSWDLKTRWCDKLVIEWVEAIKPGEHKNDALPMGMKNSYTTAATLKTASGL